MIQRLRSAVRQVHLWMGLSLGLLFALAGLTGAILVFYTDIDRLLNPVLQVEPVAKAPEWETVYRTVRAAYPDKAGPWRFEVTGGGSVIPARYYNPPERPADGHARMLVWLSPDGERVLRRSYWGETAMTWIYDLHMNLLAGETGAVIMGIAGIGMTLLLLTGLWTWWPRGSWNKALRFKRPAVRTRRLRDWHKVTGLSGLVLLLLLAITGVMLELPDESDAVLTALVSPVDAMPDAPRSTIRSSPRIAVDQAVSNGLAAMPGAALAWIETPDGPAGAYKLRMQVRGDPSQRFPHSFVWVDQYSGAVLMRVDARQASPATTINNWLHALHDGSFGGLATRILTLLAGLLPVILFVTGWRRWRLTLTQPSPSRERARQRSSLSPAGRGQG